jgi:ribonuclease HI
MKKVDLYTDGACSVNPGIGGWACILIYNSHKKELSGFEEMTTNNRMELTAVIEGLKQLKEKCIVSVYSDSAYIVDAFNEKWINSWIKKDWKISKNEDVKNADLWKDLLNQTSNHLVKFIKVAGHKDNELNNRCDFLAVNEYKKKIIENQKELKDN